ncbi:MAG: S41 family peptidase [Candidatus Cloacimonadaceae bacterium]
MKIKYVLGILILTALCSLNAFEPHFASDPAISPDGTKVCFVYNGDLWLVPFIGGTAKRLTSTSANESGPVWSVDGSTISFSANREGQTWIYMMPATGGAATPLIKETLSVNDWFADGQHLLCSKNNLNWGTSLYKVPLNGNRPILIAEVGDYFSALSPENNKIIFNRYGDPYREAYTGSKNGDLWLYDIDSKVYSRLTETDFTERYPRYSHVSDNIFFVASDGAIFQLFKAPAGDFTRPEKLTDFDIWSVRDISIARQNERIVFELFDAIWCYDPDEIGDNRIYKLPILIEEDNWSELNRTDNPADTYDSFAVSDDELLVAFSYKYDLFVIPRKGGEVKQVTFNHAGIDDLAFLNDNRTVVFSQYENGMVNLYKTKVDSIMTVEKINWYGSNLFSVDRFYRSSNHKWSIEYTDSSGSGRIAVADTTFNNIRPAVTDKVVSTGFVVSPDGTMAVFAATRDDIYVRELYLYDFNTKTRTKLLNDDSWLYGIVWMPDQKSILISKNVGGSRRIYRLDLIPRDEFELDKDNWKEILTGSGSAATEDSLSNDKSNAKLKTKAESKSRKPLTFSQIDWYQIDKRMYSILSDTETIISVYAIDDTSYYYVKSSSDKDRKTLLFKANIFGKHSSEVGSFPYDVVYQIVKDKTVYYLEGKKLKSFNLKSKSKGEINNKFQYTYNVHKLNEKVFEQVWGIFGRKFYDPNMHNRDWDMLYARFKPYLQYAESISVLNVIIEEMIGEVNASHTGFNPRHESIGISKPAAYLGLELNQRNVLPLGIEVSRVYMGSSLYSYYSIRSGDILTSINGTGITPSTPLDSLLMDMTDKKLELVFRRGDTDIKASIKGLNWRANRELWYQDKLERTRQKTNELSANRIGYVHIPSMGTGEYSKFISEVFTKNADKDALIIDIRGNSGGRIHNDLLTFLSKQPNAFTTSRSYGAVPRETPSRTWTKPIVLLIDENSFSDAEIFPQLFKEAGYGTVIGMPTSGAVIGTWEVQLLDGSSMRMPGSGWYRLDGTNMEGNGAQPDIRVEMTPNDLVADNDLQLKKAVEVLMEQIK